MARGVHFRGTVASVIGYAVSSAGSESLVINGSGVYIGSINSSAITGTTVSITTLTGTTATITNESVTTFTASSIQLIPSGTTNSIKIGSSTLGWANIPTVTTAGNVKINLDNNSNFTMTVGTNSYQATTIGALGGFMGQRATIVITAGGTGGVVSFTTSLSSVGDLTVTGTSVYLIEFLRGKTVYYEVARTAAQT